jgi:hypothetical protein
MVVNGARVEIETGAATPPRQERNQKTPTKQNTTAIKTAFIRQPATQDDHKEPTFITETLLKRFGRRGETNPFNRPSITEYRKSLSARLDSN